MTARVFAFPRAGDPGLTFQAAADAFLAQPDFAAETVHAYQSVLRRVVSAAGGGDQLFAEVDSSALTGAVLGLWGHLAPATWNRNLAAVTSFLAYGRDQGWPGADKLTVDTPRRRVPSRRQTRAVPVSDLDRLFERDLPLREKTLWTLLYESAARANEVLGLNIEELDLRNYRGEIIRKGGDSDVIVWGKRTAQLLPRLIAGRTRGPVFLTHRRPRQNQMPDPADLCPVTGRARLSYSAAEKLFKAATGGWTFHRLRHTRLNVAADAGFSSPMLQRLAGWKTIRTAQHYTRPSTDALATAVQGLDGNRSRRR